MGQTYSQLSRTYSQKGTRVGWDTEILDNRQDVRFGQGIIISIIIFIIYIIVIITIIIITVVIIIIIIIIVVHFGGSEPRSRLGMPL